MTAIAAGTILTAGLGAYKVIDGANQKAQANRLAKSNVFTPEQIPGQVKTATNLAAQNYYNGMPGQSVALNNIQRNGGNAFFNGARGASSGGDLLDLASKINVGQNAATNDLSAKAAEYKANAAGAYENALNTEGQYQDKIYKNNSLDPYLRTANTAASLYGAGSQNMFSGLDTIGSAALLGASAYSNGLKKPNTDAATIASTPADNTMAGSTDYGIGTGTSVPGIASPASVSQTGNSSSYLPYTNLVPFNGSSSLAARMAAAQLKKGAY